MLALVCGASFPYLSRLMNANERPRLLQAVAIVDHGTFALDPVLARGIAAGPDVSFAPAIGPDAVVPNKPPGATVPAVFAYGLQRLACAAVGTEPELATLTLLSRLLGAWLPTLLLAWFAARRLGDDACARAAVTIVVLATPMASYAHVLFGHSLAALCLFVGSTWLLDALGESSPSLRGRATMRAAAGGLVAALAVGVEYGVVFAAIPLGFALVVAWRRGVRQPVLAAVAAAAVPIAMLAAYQNHVFGSPWSTGYHEVVDRGFAEIHGRGLLGLTTPQLGDVLEDLFSPHGGLLYWAPVVLFVPMAWRVELPASERTFVRVQLGIFIAMLFLTLGLAQAGGWRVGPRYLVAALPAIMPALAVVLRSVGRREIALALLAGVVMWSVLVNTLAANWFPHLVPGGNPLRDQLVPLLRMDLEPYSLLDGTSGRVAGLVWVPVAGAVLVVAVVVHQVIAIELRRRVWAAAVVVVVASVVAAWSVPPADDAESTLAGLAEIWEPSGARQPKRVPLRD